MGIVDENGKPVTPTNEPVTPQGPQPDGTKPPATAEEPKLPEVSIKMKADGDLSIEGPSDIRITLALLDEAKNIVHARMSANLVLGHLARASQGVAKPGLRDVLAFSKVRPSEPPPAWAPEGQGPPRQEDARGRKGRAAQRRPAGIRGSQCSVG